MIRVGVDKCPNCSNLLRYYDKVKRRYFGSNRYETYISLPRFRCNSCRKIHRVFNDDILPYKHYMLSIIKEAIADKEEFAYENEDYPCEMTIKRWKKEYLD